VYLELQIIKMLTICQTTFKFVMKNLRVLGFDAVKNHDISVPNISQFNFTILLNSVSHVITRIFLLMSNQFYLQKWNELYLMIFNPN